MKFNVGNLEVDASIQSQSIFTSRHTGRQLRQLTITFEVYGRSQNDAALTLMNEAKQNGVSSLGNSPDQVIKWKLGNTSYHHEGNRQTESTVYDHVWHLEEIEQLKINKLTLGTFELEPYYYKEEFQGDTLIIIARVRCSEEQVKQLRDIQREDNLVSVMREGVNSEPRQMKVHLAIWSRHEDTIKQEVVLIDSRPDKEVHK